MKKAAFILTVVMLLSVFSACGETEKTPEANIVDESEQLNFYGYTFNVGIRSDAFDDHVTPLEADSTLSADATRAHIAEVCKKLNCELTESIIGGTSALQSGVATGDSGFDYLYTASYDLYGWFNAELIVDMAEVEAIDLTDSKKWGTPNHLLTLSSNGKIFGVWPRLWADDLAGGAEGVILVNDLLIADFAQPLPKELREQGQWTFDTFLDYLPSVSDLSSETKVYGLGIYPGQLFQLPLTAAFANGASMIEDSESGKHFGLTSSEALSAIEWAAEVYRTETVKTEAFVGELFSNSLCSLWLGGAWVGISMNKELPLSNLERFSWMSFPWGPNSEYGKTYSCYRLASMGVSIPIDKDYDDVGSFINELYTDRPLLTYDMNREFKRDSFFFDVDDFDLATAFTENCVHTYLYDELITVRDSFFAVLNEATTGTKTPVEAIDGIADTIQAVLDEKVNVD